MKHRATLMYYTMLLLAVTLSGYRKDDNSHYSRQYTIADSVLVSHRWFPAELIEDSADININIILMMLPCEKDNYIQYNMDKQYQIFEGDNKCSDNDPSIKAEGRWEYDAVNTTLIDKFQGGLGIRKKILILNNEVLKLEYEGENGRKHTCTYFSEKGMANKSNNEIISFTDDPGSNILQSVRKYLQLTNRYVVLSRDVIHEEKQVKADDKNGALPTVVLVPFMDDAAIKAGITTGERNNSLMGIGGKIGVDYIITGKMLEYNTQKENDKFTGVVKYELSIIDIANQAINSMIFDGNSEKTSPAARPSKTGRIFGVIEKATRTISAIAPEMYNVLPLMALTNTNYVTMYQTFWRTYNTIGHINRVDNFFGSVNNVLRKTGFDSTMSGLNAIASTEAATQAFIVDKAALIIRVNTIEGDGKKAEVTIEAGNNVSLKVGEVLNVMEEHRITLSNGKTEYTRQSLGKLKITAVRSDLLSTCTIEEKNRREIIRRIKESPGSIIVTPSTDTVTK